MAIEPNNESQTKDQVIFIIYAFNRVAKYKTYFYEAQCVSLSSIFWWKNPFDPRNLGNAFLSQLNNYYTKALDAQARTEKSLLGNNP